MKSLVTRLALAVLLLCTLGYAQMVGGASKDDWEEINFDFNSDVLTDGFPSLLRLADLLSKNPEYRVKLDGHTDSVGSEKYNEKLSQRRAAAVQAFLEKYGARPAQIELVPKGKRNPKVDNTSKEGRWINRRVAMVVTDKTGKVIGAGGIGDAIKAMQANCPDYSSSLAEILKRLDKLDDIARMLGDLKGENAKLRADVDALKGGQAAQKTAVETLAHSAPKTEDIQKIVTKTAEDLVAKHTQPRFSLLGVNAGMDNERHMTFTGKGRYFAPFKENFAFQAQGEYLYFKQRQEAQFDFGIVNRFHKRAQAGLFSSFKHVNLLGMQNGGNLGQGSFTLDYIFNKGKVGFFGTKAFLDESVVGRTMLTGSGNVWLENYLKVVDQAGVSTAISLFGKTSMEANLGMLAVKGGSNKPGGTIRFIHPLNNKLALTLEGGFNETYIGTSANGRVVAGLQFGNFDQPRDYLGMDKPVPVDIPRVRYELLTRRVRTGNSAPVADAGPDQNGVAAGQVVLDGSASFDPDGDEITYQWDQVAGPAVTLNNRNAAKATFTGAEGQTYSFRLTVKDALGLAALARTTVVVRDNPKVVIQKFTATPSTVKAGGQTTLTWQVMNADTVEISGVGSVNPQAGAVQVTVNDTTTYKLTAKNKGGEITDSVTVTVDKPTVRVLNFKAVPATVNLGESSTLVWETEGADTVTISGIGNVQPTGTTTVSPKETTTYTLTATNKSGSISSTTVITVNKPNAPKVTQFSASPVEIAEGESTRISWQVEGATEVNITELGAQTLKGSVTATPTKTTTYILTATNPGGQATASVTVTVIPKVLIGSFSATPAVTAKPGDTARLTWDTTGATNVTITGIGPVATSGSADVNPTVDTTYTLTASNSKFTVTKTVTVKVTPLPPPVDNSKPPVIVLNLPDSTEVFYREIMLDASASYDPQGKPLKFEWRVVSPVTGADNTAAALWSPYEAKTLVQIRTIGEIVLQVKVTNQAGLSATKTITLKLYYPAR